MPPESSSNENLKEAVSAATRALAQDPELEISFGGMPTSCLLYTSDAADE